MDKLEAIYNSIPKLNCKGKCQECCGPISLFPAEVEYLERNQQSLPGVRSDFTCSKLGAIGNCNVYKYRPMICRLWGVAAEMPCPFGCVPERTLSQAEAHKIMRQIEQLKPGLPYSSLQSGGL